MRKAYKDIIEKSQLIQINKNTYVCEYGKFSLFIHGTDKLRTFELFFNGIKVETEYTFGETFEYTSRTLESYVMKHKDNFHEKIKARLDKDGKVWI
jgi:hypothetical protein